MLDALRNDSALKATAIRKDVQDRMSDHAGILCNAKDVRAATEAAHALNETIRQQGIAFDGANEALRALQWRQSAIASEAVLAASASTWSMAAEVEARARFVPRMEIERPADPERTPQEVRFVSERDEDRQRQIHVRFARWSFVCRPQPIRIGIATIGRSSSVTGRTI